ncbi:hypothetical protein SUDANB145_00953 [Streptomyces sp. enrichment culture]|uniref:DUF6059 family protein n=1 Tax=Streptomyces sp. enrichment culture TaxID=1795815 RepID=UPI003F54B1FE
MSDAERGAGDGRRPGLLVVLAKGLWMCAGQLGRVVYDGLRAAGAVWVYIPPDADGPHDPADGPEPPRPVLDAPPAGHPERLPAAASPSPEEIELWARFYADD